MPLVSDFLNAMTRSELRLLKRRVAYSGGSCHVAPALWFIPIRTDPVIMPSENTFAQPSRSRAAGAGPAFPLGPLQPRVRLSRQRTMTVLRPAPTPAYRSARCVSWITVIVMTPMASRAAVRFQSRMVARRVRSSSSMMRASTCGHPRPVPGGDLRDMIKPSVRTSIPASGQRACCVPRLAPCGAATSVVAGTAKISKAPCASAKAGKLWHGAASGLAEADHVTLPNLESIPFADYYDASPPYGSCH